MSLWNKQLAADKHGGLFFAHAKGIIKHLLYLCSDVLF